ncbi:MAG: MFS transporter [Chloroflexi bacterium]|nr:MFS transporter [Chloroflexota bacterium]
MASPIEAPKIARPRIFYGYHVSAAMMVIHWYLSTAYVYGFQALFLPIISEFGWSRGVASIAASIRNVENGMMGPVIGYLVDKYGSRVAVTFGVASLGAGMVVLGMVQSLWMYYGAFMIISLGFSSIVGVPFQALIVNWFHRLRGRMLGISMSGAVASGPFVVTMVWMVDQFGWRQTSIMGGIGMWVIGLPLAWGVIRSKPADKGLLPDGDIAGSARAEASRRAAVAGPQIGVLDAVKNVNFWLVVLIFGMLSMSVSGLMLHQVPYFESVGFTKVQAASSLGYFTVLSLFGRLMAGWLMERYDGRFIMAGILGSQLAALLTMLFANQDRYWLLVVFGFFFGTTFGSMLPVRPYVNTSLFGTRAFGKIQGLLTFSAMPFSVVSPWFLGYVFDLHKSYETAIWVLVIATALTIPICFLLRLPNKVAT